jgi:hypothetical protein
MTVTGHNHGGKAESATTFDHGCAALDCHRAFNRFAFSFAGHFNHFPT